MSRLPTRIAIPSKTATIRFAMRVKLLRSMLPRRLSSAPTRINRPPIRPISIASSARIRFSVMRRARSQRVSAFLQPAERPHAGRIAREAVLPPHHAKRAEHFRVAKAFHEGEERLVPGGPAERDLARAGSGHE